MRAVAPAQDRLREMGKNLIPMGVKDRDCYIQDPFGSIYNLWEIDQ